MALTDDLADGASASYLLGAFQEQARTHNNLNVSAKQNGGTCLQRQGMEQTQWAIPSFDVARQREGGTLWSRVPRYCFSSCRVSANNQRCFYWERPVQGAGFKVLLTEFSPTMTDPRPAGGRYRRKQFRGG